MTSSVVILSISIMLQASACVVAVWNIRLTGYRVAWGCLAIAITLMTVRRCITWYKLVFADVQRTPDLAAESVALLISLCMLVGVVLIGRMFRIESATNRQALSAALEKAQRSERLKSDFLANMSHELRTPLNAVIGFAELLETGVRKNLTTEKIEHYARNIGVSGRNLLHLINDLLDFAKIESGKFELSKEPFPLLEEIANISSAFDVTARENNVTLAVNADNVDLFVNGDPIRFRQILYNLIDNGIKFSRGGNVTLTAEASTRGTDKIDLRVSITDTGIGVAPDRMESIFDPFSQSDSSITRQYGGTGLGLPISRTLAREMGGDLTVQSVEGEGSTFTASFVFDDMTKLRESIMRSSGVATEAGRTLSLTVVAVDDVPSNLDVLESMLEEFHCRLVRFDSGTGVAAWIENNDADVVLMDLHMPDVDGYRTAAEIQALPNDKGTIPIIAWTADVLAGPTLKASDVNWSGTLIKPTTRDGLFMTLKQIGQTPL